uniref:T2.2 protein n=1 Tax=Malus x robusta TaxID=1184610 RepID=I7K8L7_9ROSA|nr:T2.2 [Malus x robusta]
MTYFPDIRWYNPPTEKRANNVSEYMQYKADENLSLMQYHSKEWNSIPDGVFNLNMNSDIQKISERLQEISEQKDQLNLKIDTGALTTRARRNISPSSSQPYGPVIGRDEDKRKIVELLLKQEHRAINFDVVATQTFQPAVWVCVFDNFNLERVTKQILESITSRQCTTEDYNKEAR